MHQKKLKFKGRKNKKIWMKPCLNLWLLPQCENGIAPPLCGAILSLEREGTLIIILPAGMQGWL